MFSVRKIAAAALAASALFSAAAASAADTVDVFNRAIMGSVDYYQMGYTDRDGNFVSVAGEKILGAWADLQFKPDRKKDSELFTVVMVVPVDGAESQVFKVTGSQLIPIGNGRYRAVITSDQFNGTVLPSRYSIETYGENEKGQQVPLQGRLGANSGFHFIVTRPPQ